MAIIIGDRVVQTGDSGYQPQGIFGVASNQGGGPAGMTFGEAASVKDDKGASTIMSQQEAQEAQKTIDKNQPATAGGLTAQQLRQPKTGIFGFDFSKLNMPDFTLPGVVGAFQNLTRELRPTADSFKNKNFLAVLENEFRTNPKFNREEFYDTYKNLIDKAFDVSLGDMTPEQMFNTQTVGAFNEAVAGDLGSDIQQRVDPIGFGRELLDRGGPQTTGQAEEFAKIDLSQLTKSPEDRRLAAAVMEARAEAMDRQSRQDANMGQGIMAASPALPGISVPVGGTTVTPRPGPITTNPVLTPVPVGGVAPTTTGIIPFNINQFYASLPKYTQSGVMAPINLSRFTDALRMFPGATV